MPLILAAEDAMPALPWPYVLALCGAASGAIVALWKRDVAREAKASARSEAREEILATRLAENTGVLRDALEFIPKRP